MTNNLILIYLLLINLVGGTLFAYDKSAAKKNIRRIPENTLHLLEILGSVFANFILMYILKHKNRKFKYFAWTWAVLICWIIWLVWKGRGFDDFLHLF